MKRVLFVSYGGGHVNTLKPVYKLLQSYDHIEIDYIACTTAMLSLEKSHLKYTTYAHLLHELYSKDEQRLILKYGGELSQSMPSGMLPEDETIAYLGVNYFELVQRHGELNASEIYLRDGRQSFLPLDFAKRVFEFKRYDLVVATTAPRSEEAFYKTAFSLGIKSLCLMDIYNPEFVHNYLTQDWHARYICSPLGFKQKLESIIPHPTNIIEANNPAFDYLEHIINPDQMTNSKWSRRNIVFIKSPTGIFDEIEKNALDILIELSQKLEFELIVRHHPNDSHKLKESYEFIICDDLDVSTVIYQGSIFITVVSTVGVEASLIGKPVIQIYDQDTSTSVNFQEQRIGYRLKLGSEEFLNTVEQVLNHENSEKKEVSSYTATSPALRDYILSILETC